VAAALVRSLGESSGGAGSSPLLGGSACPDLSEVGGTAMVTVHCKFSSKRHWKGGVDSRIPAPGKIL